MSQGASRKPPRSSAGRPSAGRAGSGRQTSEIDGLQERLHALDRELGAVVREHEREKSLDASLGPGLLVTLADFVQSFDEIRTAERVDDFGRDPGLDALVAPVFSFLYRSYWRVDVDGIGNVPASGPALLVANHAGAMFPWDALMLQAAMRLDHPARRDLRPLVGSVAWRFPFLGSLLARTGAARACVENAMTLLERGEIVAAFPEGAAGLGKPFSHRYRLQRFGRSGVVRAAAAAGVPIVPVAIVGAEEIHPMIGRWSLPARLLGLPYVPVTPTFPWLGTLGLIPLPTRWTMRFGEPIPAPARPGDDVTDLLRARIQDMLDGQLRDRRSVFV